MEQTFLLLDTGSSGERQRQIWAGSTMLVLAFWNVNATEFFECNNARSSLDLKGKSEMQSVLWYVYYTRKSLCKLSWEPERWDTKWYGVSGWKVNAFLCHHAVNSMIQQSNENSVMGSNSLSASRVPFLAKRAKGGTSNLFYFVGE